MKLQSFFFSFEVELTSPAQPYPKLFQTKKKEIKFGNMKSERRKVFTVKLDDLVVYIQCLCMKNRANWYG